MAQDKDDVCKIEAEYFVDATADILLARSAGCEAAIGADDKTKYDEPSAECSDEKDTNGVLYVFRVII